MPFSLIPAYVEREDFRWNGCKSNFAMIVAILGLFLGMYFYYIDENYSFNDNKDLRFAQYSGTQADSEGCTPLDVHFTVTDGGYIVGGDWFLSGGASLIFNGRGEQISRFCAECDRQVACRVFPSYFSNSASVSGPLSSPYGDAYKLDGACHFTSLNGTYAEFQSTLQFSGVVSEEFLASRFPGRQFFWNITFLAYPELNSLCTDMMESVILPKALCFSDLQYFDSGKSFYECESFGFTSQPLKSASLSSSICLVVYAFLVPGLIMVHDLIHSKDSKLRASIGNFCSRFYCCCCCCSRYTASEDEDRTSPLIEEDITDSKDQKKGSLNSCSDGYS